MTDGRRESLSADIFSGPCTLEAQRRLAEEAGYTIVPAPDAPGDDDPAPSFDEGSLATGAAVFVRDYNLPIYPESRVLDDELRAPALVEAARDEIEPLSFAVHAIEDLEAVTVEVSALKNSDGAELPPAQLQVLEQAYIRKPHEREGKLAILSHLRLWPNEPVDIAAGRSQQFWLNVTVPADAPPGEYEGEIRVQAAGWPELRREVTVRVRPFTLAEPDDFFHGAFMTLRYFIPDRETLADFKSHGIDALLWFYSEAVWTIYRQGDSIVQYFHPMMRIVEDAMAVGMKGPIVVALGNDTHGFYEKRLCQLFDRPLRPAEPVDGKTAQVAAIDDEVINRLYVEGIRQLLEVAEQRDWPEIILLTYDEPTERLIPEGQHRHDQIKAAFPDVRVYGVTMNRLEWAEQLVPMSDILVCNGSFPGIRELAVREGKDVWGYGGAPASVGAGGARFNMGFRLWQYDLGAHWFWCYNFYSGHPWNEFGGVGNANWVNVYPGLKAGRHLPCLSWEGIREGRDDVRYCATLQKLLDEKTGPVRDRIADEFDAFREQIPTGRDHTSYGPAQGVDQDDFYATLPSYHRLTGLRQKLVGWIDELVQS
ncbi:MAG: DUF6067 family protein [Planctomycetota bacterium]